MRDLIDSQEFDKHDENADAEIQIARGFGAHRGGQRQSALPKRQHERALVLQDEVGNAAMECRDQQPEKKSRKFNGHVVIVRCGATAAQ